MPIAFEMNYTLKSQGSFLIWLCLKVFISFHSSEISRSWSENVNVALSIPIPNIVAKFQSKLAFSFPFQHPCIESDWCTNTNGSYSAFSFLLRQELTNIQHTDDMPQPFQFYVLSAQCSQHASIRISRQTLSEYGGQRAFCCDTNKGTSQTRENPLEPFISGIFLFPLS